MNNSWQQIPNSLKLLLICFVSGFIALEGEALVENIIPKSTPELSLSEVQEPEVPERVEIDFVILDINDKPLEKVKVQFISNGPPDPRTTDSNGYCTINIPYRNEVEVVLAKEGYKTLRQKINLTSDPSQTVTYSLEKDESFILPPESSSTLPATPSYIPSPLPPSPSDNSFVRTVEAQLRQLANRANYSNYELTHDPYINLLSDNSSTSKSLTLEEGVSYVIAGVCDNDCRDIDLKLFDENGNQIDFDEESDDLPVVEVKPRWTGQFQLEISLPSCSAQYCYYGVGVFGQSDSSLGTRL